MRSDKIPIKCEKLQWKWSKNFNENSMRQKGIWILFFSEIWNGIWPNLLYEIQSSIWNLLFVFHPRVTYKIQWISRHPSSEKLIKFCKRDQEFWIERTSFWSDLHRRLKIEGLRNSYFFSDLNESLHTSVKMNSESTWY